MLFYAYLYVFSMLSLFASISTKSNTNFIMITLLILTILFSGLRYGVGVDYFSYNNLFNAIGVGGYAPVEIGFVTLSSFFLSLGFKTQFLFLLYASIIVALFINFYKKYSSYPILSIVLFILMPIFFMSSFNGIRQFMAISLFLFALQYLINRKLFQYTLAISVAAMFHQSALLMLPLYFIIHNRPSIKLYLFLSVAYIIILQGSQFILFHIMNFSHIYYLQTERFQGVVDFKIYGFIFFFLLLYMLREKLIENRSENSIFINMLFMGLLILLTPVFSDLPYMLVMRMSIYFLIVVPILLVNILPIITNRPLKNMYFACLIIFITIYYWATLYFKGEFYKLLPYNFNLALY